MILAVYCFRRFQ